MAIIGQLTLDQIAILEVDVDPTASGVTAAVGSIAAIYDGSNARLWIKTAAGDTGWTPIAKLATGLTTLVNGQFLFGNSNGDIQQTPRALWDGAGRFAFGLNAPAAPQSTIHLDRGTGVGSHVRMTAGTTTGVTTGDGTEFGIDDAGNAEIRQYENSPLNFYTNNTLRGAFTAGGQLISGATSTAIDVTGAGAIPQFQILGTSAVQMAGIQYSADTIGPVFNIIKSRGATIGAQGLVSSGDEFGRIQFRASDGVNFQAGASIRALVDGTAAAGSMPGYLIMMTTPTGSITPVERMRISQNGLVRVVDAFQRRRTIMDFDTIVTANTNTNLNSSSAGIQILTGSTAGQTIRMPDAQTLVVGAEYEIRNTSSVTVAIQDNAGGALDTTPAVTGVTYLLLTANANNAGTWIARTRFEPLSQQVSSSANFTTTSGTDVLVTGMSITPISGTYFVHFDCTQTNSAGGNTNTLSVYAGGTLVTDSKRTVGTPTNFAGTIQAMPGVTSGAVTVNGSQAIEIRCRRSAGTATIQNRTMTIVRIG